MQKYTPGPHNADGYKRGWSCDVCSFLSTVDPTASQGLYRFHCSNCQADLCGDESGDVPCCRPDGSATSAAAAEAGGSIPSTPTRSAVQTDTTGTPASLRKLRHAKQLLDEGLISEADYSQTKAAVLTDLVSESA